MSIELRNLTHIPVAIIATMVLMAFGVVKGVS